LQNFEFWVCSLKKLDAPDIRDLFEVWKANVFMADDNLRVMFLEHDFDSSMDWHNPITSIQPFTDK